MIHPNYLTVALILGGFAWFTAVLLWPKRKDASGIVGTADVMLQGLDIPDLEIIDGGAAYAIDLAVFARLEVASLDKTRTITRFELEMVARQMERDIMQTRSMSWVTTTINMMTRKRMSGGR